MYAIIRHTFVLNVDKPEHAFSIAEMMDKAVLESGALEQQYEGIESDGSLIALKPEVILLG